MKVSRAPRSRPVSAVDVAASALARVVPGALVPRIDRLRHDLNRVLGDLTGRRSQPFVDPAHPAPRPLPLGAIDPVEHVLPGRGLRRRWITLRNDVAWVSRDLRGQGRSPLIQRPPSRYRATERSALSPRPVVVREARRETPDAITLVLDEVDGRPWRYEAGQFLTFELEVDGQRLRRAYSLSGSPRDATSAQVTVKRVEGGRASTWMQAVQPGTRLFVRGPSGSFVADPTDRTLVMIAGGSGITPVIAIAETALSGDPERRVRLLYGNRAETDIIFRRRLDQLAAAHPGRLVIEHSLEAPPDGWGGSVGRLDAARIEAWLDDLDVDLEGDSSRVFVCGPAAMMEQARRALAARGVSPSRIREEVFQSPDQAPPAALPTEAVRVHLAVAGEDFVLSVPPGATLLEAGLAAGAPMPFSCAMGGCAACKGRVVSGAVAMDEPNCLTDTERAAGAVLTCCARPLGDARVEVD